MITGNGSFKNTTKLSLSSNTFNYTVNLYLPQLQCIIIGENCLNEWKDDLMIVDFPRLESVVVKKNSLQSIYSVSIRNNKQLTTIEVEDYSFYNVKNLRIESILEMIIINSIFLIYNHSKQEIIHSMKQQVYLYQVILPNSTLVYIFLIYNHSKQDYNHSLK